MTTAWMQLIWATYVTNNGNITIHLVHRDNWALCFVTLCDIIIIIIIMVNFYLIIFTRFIWILYCMYVK